MKDHGKTSLTDALIATNGIISPKLAGKIRYLDSRPDEQLRGITMESSAISLYFSSVRRLAPNEPPIQSEYLINLIDSPGHIDFSSEVSTASRLCDGSVVLVDAVEGVCSQTVTVLRQTWTEKLRPLLVINKIDRLITELKMSPDEAYVHLKKLLEQVNAVMGSFFQGERMESDLRWREKIDERVAAAASAAVVDSHARESLGLKGNADASETIDAYEEKDDEDLYFSPEHNNVIFSSAIDGWAFTPRQFARLYEKKLGIKRSVLEQCLWGDFYLDPKTRRVLGSKHLKGRALKPMFVQLVLDNIWAVYEATLGAGTNSNNDKGDPAKLEKITKALDIKLAPHVLRSKDPRVVLTSVFAAWLPLSVALLVSVTERLPSPLAAQASRMQALLESSPGFEHIDTTITSAMTRPEKRSGDPVIVYVSKMVAIPESELPSNRNRGGAMSAEEARELARKKRAEFARAAAVAAGDVDVTPAINALDQTSISGVEPQSGLETTPTQHEEEHLIGFARIFSGTLTVGDEIYVISPRFTPEYPQREPRPKRVVIRALYLLMGRSLESLESAPAGSIVGIAGLEGSILKTGTLCSQVDGAPNLSSTGAISTNAPIVRVALEPAWPGDLDKMIQGLRKLEQADPAVVYERLQSGEHVIVTAGEIHLERCLKDLRERFARCDVQSGEVIVPYRETIVRQEAMEVPRDSTLGRGRVDAVTPSKQVSMRVCVRPLPEAITDIIRANSGVIKRLYTAKNQRSNDQSAEAPDTAEDVSDDIITDGTRAGSVKSEAELRQTLQTALDGTKSDRDVWRSTCDNITAFGPQQCGPNILVDATKEGVCARFFGQDESPEGGASTGDLADKITYAFQLACQQGPLCDEPLQGVAVFIEAFAVTEAPSEDDNNNNNAAGVMNVGRLTGEVIKSVRESIRHGFLDWSPRIMLAMYSCEIQASAEVLGRVYGVITRRRGRIVSEVLLEPSPNFTITALLPVAESFGFTDEIRTRTSGAASPQLVFEGFEMLDEDPFWVPTTEEELEDLGEKGDRENVAKRYVDKVRKRKGLVVQKKVVEHGEKQKTLKR